MTCPFCKKEIVDGIKSIKNIVTGKPQEQE